MPKSILDVAKQVDLFFLGASPIHMAMQRLTKALSELDMPFAIAGAMAANAHGHRRTTANVDILLRREDLVRFKQPSCGILLRSMKTTRGRMREPRHAKLYIGRVTPQV